MGHPLWDQDSAVGSQYRNLVNHNILHRKQGEWGREGDRETETDREGGRGGETEVKQAYKLSKCLLHLPSPPPPAVMYFLQQASVSESLVTSSGIPPGGDQVLILPLGDISYSNLHNGKENRIKNKLLCNGTFLKSWKKSLYLCYRLNGNMPLI